MLDKDGQQRLKVASSVFHGATKSHCILKDIGHRVDTMCSALVALRGHTVSLQQAVATTADPSGHLPAAAQSANLQAFGGQALAVEAAVALSDRLGPAVPTWPGGV